MIHIECVNSSVGGDWPVAEGTVDTLVEFLANKMRERGETKLVVGSNLYGHRDFYATYCPGVLYARLGEIAERVNARLNGDDDEVSAYDVWEYTNSNINGDKDAYQLLTDIHDALPIPHSTWAYKNEEMNGDDDIYQVVTDMKKEINSIGDKLDKLIESMS